MNQGWRDRTTLETARIHGVLSEASPTHWDTPSHIRLPRPSLPEPQDAAKSALLALATSTVALALVACGGSSSSSDATGGASAITGTSDDNVTTITCAASDTDNGTTLDLSLTHVAASADDTGTHGLKIAGKKSDGSVIEFLADAFSEQDLKGVQTEFYVGKGTITGSDGKATNVTSFAFNEPSTEPFKDPKEGSVSVAFGNLTHASDVASDKEAVVVHAKCTGVNTWGAEALK